MSLVSRTSSLFMNAAACAGALAVQKRLNEDGLLERVGRPIVILQSTVDHYVPAAAARRLQDHDLLAEILEHAERRRTEVGVVTVVELRPDATGWRRCADAAP